MHASQTLRALALAGTAFVALAAPAHAQSADAADDAPNPNEIVVTASRRSETLIEAPQSVTALSAAALEQLNATQFSDFANTVPGLNFTTLGAGRTQINLRGVTTGFDVGPTVGIYVDEVPYGASSSYGKGSQLALDVGLFDLDRIEVLRGPQGTLYGASSMGGVLKYVTKAPSLSEFSGGAQAGVSTIRHGATNFNGAAAINAPIGSDVAGIRASGFFSRSGGYVDNIGTGDKGVDRSDVYGARIDALVKPTPDLSIRLTGFGQNIRRDGALYSDYTLGGDPIVNSLTQDHPLAERFTSDFRLASGTIEYDFGAAKLTSVSSYQYIKSFIRSDVSDVYPPLLAPTLTLLGLPVPAAADLSEVDVTKKFTQEVRLASSGDQKIEWLVGGYYNREKSQADQIVNSYTAAGALIPALNIGTLIVPSKYQEWAAFGNVTVHFGEKFDVTGGIRYARNKQDFEQIATGLLVAPAPLQTSKESVTTYLANARYKFSEHVTAYARFATGYRPGGPNYRVVVGGVLLSTPTYTSDTLKSYEIGLKGETDDRTFGFDLSAYLIDWKGLQIATAAGGISFIANAGDARVKGAEMTLTARPSADFTATAAFAYNDGYVTEDNANLRARAGERLPNAPHVTATVGADYVMSDSAIAPSFGATLRFIGERTSSFDASVALPQYVLPSYVSFDLRAGAELGPVKLQAYVHNLFDTRQQLSAATIYAPYGAATRVTIAQPRTIGLSASTRF